MKKIYLKLLLIFTNLLILPNITRAVDSPGEMLVKTGRAGGIYYTDTPELVGQIIKGFIGFMGSVFMLLIIYAGFLWMTAQGNEESIVKAKRIIQNSTIGLLVAVLSYVIVQFVFDTLTTAGL